MEDEKDKTEPILYSEVIDKHSISLSSRFKNLKFLGAGGSGRVYKAYDTILNDYVAIKLIPKKGLSDEAKKRIIREVKVSRNLQHKNLLKYFDINEDKNNLIIIMEYIDGKTLEQEIKKSKTIKEEKIKEILYDLNEVIKYLHSQEIIHRDIKPANIFITKDGKIKLGDFGIIHLKDEFEKLTKTEQAIGTPTYMSPEQLTGKEISEKSDYYSLGITIYEMIKGDVPFQGTIGQIVKGHLNEEIPPLENLEEFNKLIKGLTIKDPKKRWGYEEIKKHIEGKRLPFLPEQKTAILISIITIFFFLLFYLFIYPFFKINNPKSVEFSGKKLKVSSEKKILFEKEMNYEISDAKIKDFDLDGKNEVVVSYKIKPDIFPKNITPDALFEIGQILNKKGISIQNLYLRSDIIAQEFYNFSLNYHTEIFPLIEINEENKVKNNNFYIRTYHAYYPCMAVLPKDIKYPERESFMSSDGTIHAICRWKDKIIVIGYINTFLHQVYISFLSSNMPIKFHKNSFGLEAIISFNLIGFKQVLSDIKFIPENNEIKMVLPDESFILQENGELKGQKIGTATITKMLIEDYIQISKMLENKNLENAEKTIEKNLDFSEVYNLNGFAVLFALQKAELEYLKGKKDKAVQICLEYGNKYKKYGYDLIIKAGCFEYLSKEYKKAINLWQNVYPSESIRSAEALTFPIFALILEENWKDFERYISSPEFSKEGIWFNYLRYQMGISSLIKKDVKKSIEILKQALSDIEQEDNATFYFLAKFIEGNPDIENYNNFISKYPKGPLHLQFAGACTKNDFEKAKILYRSLEDLAVHDTGASFIYPVIRKIIEKYPEKFSFIYETH